MKIEYQQIHPVSGLWPEWPERLMLRYDPKSDDPKLTELFWHAPYQLIGCRACGLVHPLPLRWISLLRSKRQFFYCRECAATGWDRVPQKRCRLDCKKVHPLEPYRFGPKRWKLNQKAYDLLWRRHELQARLNYLLHASKNRKQWSNNLDLRTLLRRWYEQGGLCALSWERPMRLRKIDRDWEAPSIDRLWHKGGYLNDNVQLSCWEANWKRKGRDFRRCYLESHRGFEMSDAEWFETKRMLP
jgi:hypothetical protein